MGPRVLEKSSEKVSEGVIMNINDVIQDTATRI